MSQPNPQQTHTVDAGARFEELYAEHHRAILAYCARRASRADAWDAAAEVFATAWRRIDSVPHGEATLPWLFGVAYRVLSNQHRSRRRRSRLAARAAQQPMEGGPMPDAQVIRSEEETEVLAALDRLRPHDREVLLLSLWEELPIRQIATALGISRPAVDQRISRAKRRLAKELDQTTKIMGRATPTDRAEGGAP